MPRNERQIPLLPMRTVVNRSASDQPTAERLLVIMLPGAYSSVDDFRHYGFIDDLRRQHPDADVVLADAHPGYFANGDIVERIATDLVGPAREAGYRRIGLLGISLGGLGALRYAAEHGATVNTVLAIAPYPGSRVVWQPILDAGSLEAWQAPQATPPRATHSQATVAADLAAGGESVATPDPELRLWQWLRQRAPQEHPRIVIGYGRADRFAAGQTLLASRLRDDQVLVRDGGHEWPVWQEIWRDFLASGGFGSPHGSH